MGNAYVTVAPRLRVADELDLRPDLLVLDFGLATIGLVHIAQVLDKEPLVEQAKRHIDQATYLRHLLGTHAVKAGTESFPLDYTVECVLVMQEEDAPQMVDVVREIAAKTKFLHATGLNLLNFRSPCEFQKDDLRRAFAWLLAATRERLSGCKSPCTQLQRLELNNYRLPGRRAWELQDSRVHLLHGANGTGKSSIAEALELVMTGSVERINTNPQPDYARIIRNSESTGPATVRLFLTDGRKPIFTVITAGIEEPALQKDLPASAFRLDQMVMDQLIRTNSQQRAGILTKAFFPGEAYSKLESAQAEFNNTYRELPVELRDEIATTNPKSNDWPAAIIPRLAWIEAPSIPLERISDCLPLKREHLETLGRIVPEITTALKSLNGQLDRQTLEIHLKQLDEALGGIRSNVRRYWEAVVQCLKVLPGLDGWRPESGKIWLEYPEVLSRWTERLALSDLLKKHLDISKTLLDARTAGWQIDDNVSVGLLAASVDSLRASIADLTRAAQQCNKEQENLFNQLQKSSVPPDSGEGEKHLPTTLSTSEIQNLNLIGDWLAKLEPTQPSGSFGDTIQNALSENSSKVFGTITIGAHGWTERPLEFLAIVKPAFDVLLAFEHTTNPEQTMSAADRSIEPAHYRSPLVRMHAYQAALTSARQVVTAYEEVEATLMKRLAEQRLNEALNEVIALFTPARWAYEGLLIKSEVLDGKVSLKLETTKWQSQAEMRLNTAELNLIVLALYLLCGPTIDNSLGAIILDDPLQNMDELTSATVARGVTKVAALLPAGWRLIMMFHGEEDLEAFRREVPGSVYYLPWLGPIGATRMDRNDVQPDTRRYQVSPPTQKLDRILKLNLHRRRLPNEH